LVVVGRRDAVDVAWGRKGGREGGREGGGRDGEYLFPPLGEEGKKGGKGGREGGEGGREGGREGLPAI